jgi:hypothetical protein
LHLLSLLTDDDRLRIRSALPGPSVIVARSAVDDALLARDHMRNLSAATYTASLAPDGTIDRTILTPAEQALLLTQAEALETAASSAQARQSATTAGAAADTIAVARESQIPLWCDDIALRQKARIAGVAAFSLLDLITVLKVGGATFDLPGLVQGRLGLFGLRTDQGQHRHLLPQCIGGLDVLAGQPTGGTHLLVDAGQLRHRTVAGWGNGAQLRPCDRRQRHPQHRRLRAGRALVRVPAGVLRRATR